MTKETQREWPRQRPTGVDRTAPTAFFVTVDGYLKSERSLAGPLRMGTAPNVGPRGALREGGSDFGNDRTSPRGFDPEGTSDTRAPPQEASTLISRQVRGRRNDR